MKFHAFSAEQLASGPLPGPSAVLQMADDYGLLPTFRDDGNARLVRSLVLHDADGCSKNVKAPTANHAEAILSFFQEARQQRIPHFVAQCQAGVGRSVAVAAALAKISGADFPLRLTYNRALFRAILAEAGLKAESEPLVSIALRVKYEPDRLQLFLLSMLRQRYDNWEVVAFTDGPDPEAAAAMRAMADPRVRLLETPEPRGRWGYPYRQLAFEACRGKWIGAQNDDNYLTPGFLEQLVAAGEQHDAGVVMCQPLHRYSAWSATPAGTDLGTWIARDNLIHNTPWTGVDFTSDQAYLAALLRDDIVNVEINRPLMVKN